MKLSPGSMSGWVKRSNAVHLVVEPDPVKVNVGAHRELVVEGDRDSIAVVHPDSRARYLTVVGPRLDELPGLDLPGGDCDRDVVLLGSIGQNHWLQELVAAALGRRLERRGCSRSLP